MGVLSRSIGAFSFLLLVLSLFLPWFFLSSDNLPQLLTGELRPIELLSNFYSNLQPVVFFVIIPLLFVYVGAIYCLFRPEVGGRLSFIALIFLLSMISLIYYFDHRDLSELLSATASSIREGFLIAAISSLASALTGLRQRGRRRSGSYVVYTGEEEP